MRKSTRQSILCVTLLSFLYFVGLLGVVFQDELVLWTFCTIGVVVLGVIGVWVFKGIKVGIKTITEE